MATLVPVDGPHPRTSWQHDMDSGFRGRGRAMKLGGKAREGAGELIGSEFDQSKL